MSREKSSLKHTLDDALDEDEAPAMIMGGSISKPRKSKRHKRTSRRDTDLNNAENTTASETQSSREGRFDYPLPASVENEVPLSDLLDLSRLVSLAELDARFRLIAQELLHGHFIEIRTASDKEHYEILELEFYLYKEGIHEDPFTHASNEQSESGRWYFHRPPVRSTDFTGPPRAGKGYRGGTRKGLDLTIGNPPLTVASKYFASSDSPSMATTQTSAPIVRGGVLLRSIRRVRDARVISGPSLLVDEVLRASGAKDIPTLVETHWAGDIGAFGKAGGDGVPKGRTSAMRIVRTPVTVVCESSKEKKVRAAAHSQIYRSPRIGLDLSHPSVLAHGGPGISSSPVSGKQSSTLSTTDTYHPRVHFVARPYRFFTAPHLLVANGRPHSFLGVYDALAVTTGLARVDEVARRTGLGSPTVQKYRDALQAGAGADADAGAGTVSLRGWVGAKGKAAAASPAGWLGMVGALRRLGVVGDVVSAQEGSG